MSVHWNIACRKCGRGTEWCRDFRTNHKERKFALVCASGILTRMSELAEEYRLAVPDSDFELMLVDGVYHNHPQAIDLVMLHGDCDHDWCPYNEYNEWADDEAWPPWHPNSRQTTHAAGGGCVALHDSAKCSG